MLTDEVDRIDNELGMRLDGDARDFVFGLAQEVELLAEELAQMATDRLLRR